MKVENTHKEKRREDMKNNQKRYCDKMRSNGMVQLCVWIPKSILEKVKKYIERLKDD